MELDTSRKYQKDEKMKPAQYMKIKTRKIREIITSMKEGCTTVLIETE